MTTIFTEKVTSEKIDRFWQLKNQAEEMDKQIGMLTRQMFGNEATFDGLKVLERRNVVEAYIKYGGDLD